VPALNNRLEGGREGLRIGAFGRGAICGGPSGALCRECPGPQLYRSGDDVCGHALISKRLGGM